MKRGILMFAGVVLSATTAHAQSVVLQTPADLDNLMHLHKKADELFGERREE